MLSCPASSISTLLASSHTHLGLQVSFDECQAHRDHRPCFLTFFLPPRGFPGLRPGLCLYRPSLPGRTFPASRHLHPDQGMLSLYLSICSCAALIFVCVCCLPVYHLSVISIATIFLSLPIRLKPAPRRNPCSWPLAQSSPSCFPKRRASAR